MEASTSVWGRPMPSSLLTNLSSIFAIVFTPSQYVLLRLRHESSPPMPVRVLVCHSTPPELPIRGLGHRPAGGALTAHSPEHHLHKCITS
ncbi:hypothetical protein HNP48_002714 [Acidovorax soli]|uniref:Uncharacterized protein n=1 Tax=Acidovorax soli TaxID=592050 RepID=A0A7X0U9A4_9BURK|nr:hypothetical protein [Acidovorax soli]